MLILLLHINIHVQLNTKVDLVSMKSLYRYDRSNYVDSVLLQYNLLLWTWGSAVSGGGQWRRGGHDA